VFSRFRNVLLGYDAALKLTVSAAGSTGSPCSASTCAIRAKGAGASVAKKTKCSDPLSASGAPGW
jgi:hypothetical protein